MDIKKIQGTDKITLELSGRLDTTTAPQLQEAMIPVLESPCATVLDFNELAYVSSAGLRVLLLGEKTAKAKGVTLTLINVSPDVKEVFDMTGFTDILTIA